MKQVLEFQVEFSKISLLILISMYCTYLWTDKDKIVYFCGTGTFLDIKDFKYNSSQSICSIKTIDMMCHVLTSSKKLYTIFVWFISSYPSTEIWQNGGTNNEETSLQDTFFTVSVCLLTNHLTADESNVMSLVEKRVDLVFGKEILVR